MKFLSKIMKYFCSLLFVIIVSTGFFSINIKANTTNKFNKEKYTDSDEFEYNSKIYNINQYSTELYNTRGGFVLNGGLHIPEWVNKGEDDPIVKIIPKYLFNKPILITL